MRPAGTEAVLVNLTMTEADQPGYITADRCSALRADQNADKQFSNGNYVVGQNIANLAVVRIDTDGKFCIFTKTPVNVIADVQGRFAPSGSMKFARRRNSPIRYPRRRQAGSAVDDEGPHGPARPARRTHS